MTKKEIIKTISIIILILIVLILAWNLLKMNATMDYFFTEVVEVKCFNRAGDGSGKFYINIDDTLTINDTGAWRSDRTTSMMTWELQNKCEIKRYFEGLNKTRRE